MAKRLPAGKDNAPEMTSLNAAQLEALLASLQPLLPGAVYDQVAGLLGTLQWVMELIQKKNTTIARLQRLIFGASTEKTANIFPQPPVADPPAQARPKGHGRNGADRYVGAQRVAVTHPSLRAGAACPDCQNDKGKLGPRPPSRIVRITAQPVFSAAIFELQQLRCNLCGRVYTAPAPPEAGTAKYAPNVGLMLGLLRFGSGLPHYRMEKMQQDFGVPLPSPPNGN